MDSSSEGGIDRISALPDDILCHMLSFLPTKYTVGTSALSTRWKYLWTYVPILDFDARLHQDYDHSPFIYQYAHGGLEKSFLRFVNRVMLLNVIPHFRKLRFVYECQNGSAPISTWLLLAISRYTQELELDFYLSVQKESIKFPRKFFMSNTLVVLKLSRMPLIIPSSVCFPMLKILEIRRVLYLDDKSTQNLLSGCQVLEELLIEETTREKPRVIVISIQTLKKFSFSYIFRIDISVDYPYKFIINTPNLEFFHVKGHVADVFEITSLASLINVHLDLRHSVALAYNYNLCFQCVYNLLERMVNAKFVTLSKEIVQCLSIAHDLNLPTFSNLTKLVLGIGIDFNWTRLVTKFIKGSPDLTVLNLNNKHGFFRDFDEFPRVFETMPGYLVSHLKVFFIEEIYSSFLPEYVQYLVHDVNAVKRLKMNCQCPFLLKYQTGCTRPSAPNLPIG